MALLRGFHDGSGYSHRKAEYTNATAPALPGLKQKASAGEKPSVKMPWSYRFTLSCRQGLTEESIYE